MKPPSSNFDPAQSNPRQQSEPSQRREELEGPAVAPTEVAIQINGLNLWYGKFQALHDITLSFPARSATAIIGPSGCGKSTLLRTLNRLHEVTAGTKMTGRAQLFQEDLYSPSMDPTQLRRRVGMVFQKSNPFPTLSLRENVLVGLRLNGIRDRQFLEHRLEECLKMAALWDEVKHDLNRASTSLSGGQQQRLCIARAIAMQPEVLLMDEPCSALDPIATAKVEELIHQLKRQFTIVIVTHNLQQAARVSDFTAFMYLGRLVEFGSTDHIFRRPTQKQTEDYITGRFG